MIQYLVEFCKLLIDDGEFTMNNMYIISKMNEFMFQLNEKMGTWLSKKLPVITDNWWQELVVNNLSTLQRGHVQSNGITSIDGLDLAELLRVFDRNWFVITSRFFISNKERSNVRKMQEVRNSWAHITPGAISKEKVISGVDTIIALMQTFGASMKETRDMERFIFDVEEDKEIKTEEVQFTIIETSEPDVQPTSGIKVGDVVTLVSDVSIIGAVTEIEGNKYSVLINGVIQSFYGEQIQSIRPKRVLNNLPIKRVRSSLTAYQINNPGNSNFCKN